MLWHKLLTTVEIVFLPLTVLQIVFQVSGHRVDTSYFTCTISHLQRADSLLLPNIYKRHANFEDLFQLVFVFYKYWKVAKYDAPLVLD